MTTLERLLSLSLAILVALLCSGLAAVVSVQHCFGQATGCDGGLCGICLIAPVLPPYLFGVAGAGLVSSVLAYFAFSRLFRRIFRRQGPSSAATIR